MAFEFVTRDPSRIFFPTVHVHDGEVHEQARFDHRLYAQAGPGRVIDDARWQWSEGPLGSYADVDRSASLVEGTQAAQKLVLRGLLPNKDTTAQSVIGAPPFMPPAL